MKNIKLEEIYRKHHIELYLYALSLCQNHHYAQDLVSETFYKALLSLDHNKDYIKFWLFRVCKNIFLDHVRKNKYHVDIHNLEEVLSDKESPLDKLINNEERKQLYYNVLKLPYPSREAIILYYYCNFSLREIAKAIHISEGAAKTLLFRARQKLKTELKEEKQNEV